MTWHNFFLFDRVQEEFQGPCLGSLSFSSGRMKRAVLVATGADLATVSDARAMRTILIKAFGYDATNIRLLHHEKSRYDPLYASRRRIREACAWLVRGARAGDSLFFYFGGHGGDGFVSVCPANDGSEGTISGERLQEWLVTPLRSQVKIHIMIDACHAGSLAKLRFTLQPILERRRGVITKCISKIVERHPRSSRSESGRSTPIVIVIAACNATQTAVETTAASAPIRNVTGYGFATYAFRRIIEKHGSRLAYGEFYSRMYVRMMEHGQVPRVYSNCRFSTHATFRL